MKDNDDKITSEQDFWDDLPQHIGDGIAVSKKQAEQGLLKPHEEVMKKYNILNVSA